MAKLEFLNSEGRAARVLGTLYQLILLNLLTLFCCLPVFTIGAAVTSMNYCLLRLIRKEESYLTKDFFHSFRENFRQASCLWLIKLCFLIPMAADLLLIENAPETMPKAVSYVVVITGFIVMMLLAFTFPLQSHFYNTLSHTLANSFRLGAAKFPRAFVMTFVWVLPGWILLHILFLFPVVLMLGISLPGYVCARLYEPVFRELESE
ncbi:MAG: YesL family protein [Blautia sp.]|nr:YesL family protein [Blautia sp.]